MELEEALTKFAAIEEKMAHYEKGNAISIHPDELLVVTKLLQREQRIVNYLYEALGPANDDILDMADREAGWSSQ